MSRAAVLVLLCAVAASVVAQQTHVQPPSTSVQQTPGVLERLMEQYVYPLRNYNWRNAFRNLMESVMSYVAPATKEPKSGYVAQDRAAVMFRDVLSTLVAILDALNTPTPALAAEESPDTSVTVLARSHEQARLLLGPLFQWGPDKNSFINANTAGHSWDYLGYLWLFATISILSAIVPLYKYIPEEELLYPNLDKAAPAEVSLPNGKLKEDYPLYSDEEDQGGPQYDGYQNDDVAHYVTGAQDHDSYSHLSNDLDPRPPQTQYHHSRHYPPPHQ